MNSRERILAAIEHKQPDRIPIDLGATPSSGISAIAYGNLKKHLGMNGGHTRIYDVCQQVAQPEETILDHYGVDVVDVGRMFNRAESDWYDITLVNGQKAQYPAWFHPRKQSDGTWVGHKNGKDLNMMPLVGAYFDQTHFPYLEDYPADYKNLAADMDTVHWAAFAHSPWDHAGEASFWEDMRRNALELRKSTDRAIMVVCGCNLFEWGTFLRRLDNFLMDLCSEQEEVERFLDAIMEIHMATLEKVCAAVGDVADVLRFGDDLGIDTGPFMAPATYRKLFKPRHAQLCAYVHKNSKMKTFLHSCGSIYDVIPDLIEAGYDVLNPIQTTCRNMEPERLKREFGKDICFWGGGCDTRSILNRATPEQVRRHVLERLEILSPGGGYVFNTVHNILSEVPPENIDAMYKAVAEFNG